MRRLASLVAVLGLLAVSAVGALAQPAEPQEGCDYYEETGHNLCEPFQEYWTNNGGLPVFGYPITEAENELNLDLDEEFLTQYFERERMEHHPANAGTPYEVLLGRLGNEVLLEMDRDWTTFPKADPSAEHYFAETGHAIAPEFWDYWSSHGLDFGDDGFSFAESLALFGYPISEPAVETNSSGDTVLTQWFERARFEHHPDNPEEFQVLLGLLGNEILALRGGSGPPELPDNVAVIADGLDNPRHLVAGANDTVYVAEAGAGGDQCFSPDPEDPEFELCIGNTGGVTMIADGEQTRVAELPSLADSSGMFATGPHDLVVTDDSMTVAMGLGASATERDGVAEQVELASYFGTLVSVNGEPTIIADIATWENENNPDESSDTEVGSDSNPYGVAMMEDGSYVVADAGGNSLLHVQEDGSVEVIAIFEPRLVEVPPEFQEPGGPTEIPMQAVPTAAVQGPDGEWYVSQLTGFPFPVGGANIYRISSEGEVSVYADGLSAVVDLDMDAEGNLYAVEMAKNGLFGAETAAPDDFEALAGAVVKIAPDLTMTEILSQGLILPGGVAVGSDGTVYVSNYSIFPDMGQVVAIPAEAPEPVGEVIAEGLNSPRGLHVADDGTVYVAQAGVGGDDCISGPTPEGEEGELCFGTSGTIVMVAGGEQSDAVSGLNSVNVGPTETLGPHDVMAGEDGLYVMMGGLAPATPLRDDNASLAGSLGWVVMADAEGVVTQVADITAYEIDANPDGGAIDSNPFSLTMDGAGGWVVSDAGMNGLVHIEGEGALTTLAVFEDRMVDAPPFLELPEGTQIPMQTVPTGITMGPDGAFYVGELTGFPFELGAARVWRVTAEGEAEVYAEGFTNVIDVAFDADGNLYVLEMIAGSLLNATDDPASVASRIVQVAQDGTQTTVVDSGLFFATGLAVGPDGSLFVSNFGVMPGMGQVVKIDMSAS